MTRRTAVFITVFLTFFTVSSQASAPPTNPALVSQYANQYMALACTLYNNKQPEAKPLPYAFFWTVEKVGADWVTFHNTYLPEEKKHLRVLVKRTSLKSDAIAVGDNLESHAYLLGLLKRVSGDDGDGNYIELMYYERLHI